MRAAVRLMLWLEARPLLTVSIVIGTILLIALIEGLIRAAR